MKKFLTIVLAIVMIATMFVMVGCGKTAGNNNEDGSTNNKDGNNSVIDTDKNNNNKTEELVNKPFFPEPDSKNLVGIAVYPIEPGEKYPYVERQMVEDFSGWHYFYLDDEVSNGKNTLCYRFGEISWEAISGEESKDYFNGRVPIFDDKIIDRKIYIREESASLYVGYASNNYCYLGYIYQVDGSLYIMATEQLADEGNSVEADGGLYLGLHCYYPTEATHYRYLFQIDDVKDENGWYVGRTVYSSEIYTIDTLPTEITFKKDPWVNFVAIEMIANGEIIGTRKIAYYAETPYVGNSDKFELIDLYKDGESYQHVVTVNKEK